MAELFDRLYNVAKTEEKQHTQRDRDRRTHSFRTAGYMPQHYNLTFIQYFQKTCLAPHTGRWSYYNRNQ